MRWIIATACLIVFAIGVALVLQAPDVTRPPAGGIAILYIGIVISWGFVGVGASAAYRRPENHTGALMVLVGLLVAVTGLQFFDSTLWFVIGALFDTFAVSALVHLLNAFPSGRLETRAARRVVAVGYGAGVLQLPLLMVSPCTDDCPGANPLLVRDSEVLQAVVGVAQLALGLIAIAGTIALVLRRRRASSPGQRRSLEPVLLLGALILALGVATVASQALGDRAMRVVQLVFFSTFALVPAAFLLGLVRARFFHTATVGRVIDRLAADPRSVRDALAEALDDPTLDVVYWVGTAYVDREGRPAPEPGEGQVRTEIPQVGALDHDARLCETPALLHDAAAAAALALKNARLEVELRARLEALRASRARLVEAGDAERRRLGRDLHDGAQQRLVALMIELQLAREHFTSDPESARALVDSAFANAQEAVNELRDLAAGIHPAVLSQRGLEAALESLASRAPVPVVLDSALPERLPSPVETAAYFVVAEALTNVAKYADATHARVSVSRENGHAVIDVHDDGVGGADASTGSGLRGLGDRVGALDGTLEVHSPRGEGTLVRARIPLGAP
jgi:signal transduction histidine kinase